MRILVMNCNVTASMTDKIAAGARRFALPGTEIIGAQPTWGPASAEGYYESFITAAAVLDRLSTYPDPFDGVVMAGFGEHGREGARQLLGVPVVDITEAAAQLATLVSRRFGVVTTEQSAVAAIADSLTAAGLISRCSGIVASDISVLDTGGDAHDSLATITRASRALIDGGADAIVLGCAGFTGLDDVLEELLGVPVIDGVTAAVALCESLVRLGKTTSKQGPYAAPDLTKASTGWPIGGAFATSVLQVTS